MSVGFVIRRLSSTIDSVEGVRFVSKKFRVSESPTATVVRALDWLGRNGDSRDEGDGHSFADTYVSRAGTFVIERISIRFTGAA